MEKLEELCHKVLCQVINGYTEPGLLAAVIDRINPNLITKGEIGETGEVCHYPVLLQAIVRKNLSAVQQLLYKGASPHAHYYIIDRDQNCIYAISAKDMAHKIHYRDFSSITSQIYDLLNAYCDKEE